MHIINYNVLLSIFSFIRYCGSFYKCIIITFPTRVFCGGSVLMVGLLTEQWSPKSQPHGRLNYVDDCITAEATRPTFTLMQLKIRLMQAPETQCASKLRHFG